MFVSVRRFCLQREVIVYLQNLPCKANMYMQNSMPASDKLNFTCLASTSRRTSRAVTNFFNARMKPLELNVAQFGLLAAIANAPGQSLTTISEAMLLDESTMARNLGVLERRGLVASEGGRGRGGKQVSLTSEGRALYGSGARIWKQANVALESAMDAKQVAAGRLFMSGLTAAAERLRGEDEIQS
jgi:DNA-binding MarR family transcriptional regulator